MSNKKKVVDLLKISKKAYSLQSQADATCGTLADELKKYYKEGGFDDEQDEKWYVESLGVFVQAGDGLCINDSVGSNIPVREILEVIYKNGHFTYKDLMDKRI